jgi:hypothetical protein
VSSYIEGTLIGALIVAVTTVLVFMLTGRREKRIRAEERALADKGELQQAMREYLAAVDAAVLEAEREFPPPRMSRADRWIERTLDGTSMEFLALIIVRLLQRAMYGRRPGEVTDRLAAASAHLRLIAPPAVEAYMVEAEALTKEHKPSDDKWQEEWKAFRARMRQGFRQALDDHSVGARARRKARRSID